MYLNIYCSFLEVNTDLGFRESRLEFGSHFFSLLQKSEHQSMVIIGVKSLSLTLCRTD